MALKDMNYDGEYIVGGNPFDKVTPNFKLREFIGAEGSIRVHRELVVVLQMLRDLFGKRIDIQRENDETPIMGEEGRYAWIHGEPIAELTARAREMEHRGYFHKVQREGDLLCVRIADRDEFQAISLDEGWEKSVLISAGFDGVQDPFQAVVGNVDGNGLSFGPSKVSFKAGTLPPLFKKLIVSIGPALEACFMEHFPEWLMVINKDRQAQIAWADGISTGSRKRDVVQPWKGYFEAVGRLPECRVFLTEQVIDTWRDAVAKALNQLYKIKPYRITHLRCFAALYDLVVCEGSLNKALEPIRKRVKRDQPQDQLALMRIVVEERARKASKSLRAEYTSRWCSILERKPVAVSLDGKKAHCQNGNFYLLRDVDITGMDKLYDA